jgi:hypothetical protein
MLLGRYPAHRIAKVLRVNRNTISADIRAIREDWKSHRSDAYEQYSAEEIPKLDALEQAVWAKAMAGDNRAIDRVLAIMQRRAALIGLDAPEKSRIEVITRDQLLAEIEKVNREIAALEAKGVPANLEALEARSVSTSS